MSPTVLKEGELVFWFHSYDVQHENRASVHVGKGSQNDSGDSKIWLEPTIEIARAGRSLKRQDMDRALKVIERNLGRIKDAWYDHKRKTA